MAASTSPLQRLRQAPDEGDVAAVQVAIGEALRQRLVCALRLGHDHDAGGLLVQPVDDAGALLAADAGQLVAGMGEQGVDQRAVEIARRGMDDEARRLVEDDEVRSSNRMVSGMACASGRAGVGGGMTRV